MRNTAHDVKDSKLHVQVQVQVDFDQKLGWKPRRFICETTCTEINEILDQWPEGNPGKTYPRTHYFKVRSADGYRYLLRHDASSDEWYVDDRW